MTHNKILKVMVAFVMMIILMFTSVVPTFAVSIGTQTYISTGESTGFSCTKDGFHYDFLYMKIRGSNNDYVYCAEPGAGWTETYYKVQAPKDDAYWKSLSKTKKEGMTLACMFGYPTQSAKTLGASTGKEAYAATQAIVWEYASGVRTKATGNPTNTAFRGALNKSALAAYNNILSQMNTYMNASGYSAEELFSNTKAYVMSTA